MYIALAAGTLLGLLLISWLLSGREATVPKSSYSDDVILQPATARATTDDNKTLPLSVLVLVAALWMVFLGDRDHLSVIGRATS